MLTIVCPECGAEYLPAEIFYPKDFFGNPKNISKDRAGKIQFFSGVNMNVTESYICDYCKRKMTVTADIVFDVSVLELPNTHITKFKKPKLTMAEND